MKKLILLCLFMVGCMSVPTGEVRKVDGKKWVEVQKSIGPMKLYKTLEPSPAWHAPILKQAAAPARALLWIAIPGSLIAIGLMAVSRCPLVQKRLLSLAMVLGATIPLCWAIMLATASPLTFIPIVAVAMFLVYYAFRKRGLLFSSSQEV